MPKSSCTRHNDSLWLANLDGYKAFVLEHGRGDVAHIKKFDKRLSIWVNRNKCALTAGSLSPERVAALQAAGMTPAQRTVRRSRNEASQSRDETLQELQAFVQLHGHAYPPTDESKSSLSERVIKLKSIAKQRDPVLLEKLTRLGVFKRYPDFAWERGFSAWREYVARTGDFRCEVRPPTEVRQWAFSVREQLAQLTMPLPWLTCDRKQLRKPSRERACVLAAMGRLAAAGFTLERKTLSQSDLFAAKLAKMTALPLHCLSLRTVLRVLSLRQRAGNLSAALAADLEAAGLSWCAVRQAWRRASDLHNLAGERVTTPKTAKLAKAAKTVANKRKLAELRVDSNPLEYVPRSKLSGEQSQAVQDCVMSIVRQLSEPASERQIIHHPAMSGFRKSLGTSRIRSELSFAVFRFHKEGKIAYSEGMPSGSPWSRFHAAPAPQTANSPA
jgi:hypothetical protein